MSSKDKSGMNETQQMLAQDDVSCNPDHNNTIGDVINRRFDRRNILAGMLGTTAISALLHLTGSKIFTASAAQSGGKTNLSPFKELKSGVDEKHHVAEGYHADILLRWGDPVFENSPVFDPYNQSAEAQLMQFGYNNDYVGFVPLNEKNDRGLLCVNHEYTNKELMFPNTGHQDKKSFPDWVAKQAEIEMAAHGGTIIEIEKKEGKWHTVTRSKYNRRISPLVTDMTIDGPAAGDDLLKTSLDRTGTKVRGTINNCAGGMTPWGTWLMAEENIRYYFYTDQTDYKGRPDKNLIVKDSKKLARYGMPARGYAWGRYHKRFNIDKEPHECNRFGWVVEVDPLNPNSVPVKHTALGRFQHEGCETVLNKDGRIVVYSGDDSRFEYVYKFVSMGKFDKANREKNKTLLTDGTLYAARFNDNGTVNWLPLVYGEAPLTKENGFSSQAEVLIHARLAAQKLGATPMDRPEDVEPVGDGRVYVMLTNNSKRKSHHIDAANPRVKNYFGHIIEINEPDADHASIISKWEILVKCGDPEDRYIGACWHEDTSKDGWFAAPDNCAIDHKERLWISTDQGKNWSRTGKADGLYLLETRGEKRGLSRLFFRSPVGAELSGPCFVGNKDLFLSIQHPAADGVKKYKIFGTRSTFENPATRWPDFDKRMPPRPSVIVVTRKDGKEL